MDKVDDTIYRGDWTGPDGAMTAVIFWDEIAYAAQCIERDCGSQAATASEAFDRLVVTVALDEATRKKLGVDVVRSTPAEFRDMLAKASMFFGGPTDV